MSSAIKYYYHPRCSTCKKAKAFLEANGISPHEIDITQKAPTKADLKAMLKVYGGDLRRLFNTSGMQYRDLGLKDKVGKMSEKQALDLLSSNGMLVKRPFLLFSGGGLVGFRVQDWKAALL
ncbi:MAG: arsenate reductase family protein [Bdellovibrionales bacterium]|nr:arsenate reductase family protein [Bdellovibrionales bacterium]